jgi:hypothetical protein
MLEASCVAAPAPPRNRIETHDEAFVTRIGDDRSSGNCVVHPLSEVVRNPSPAACTSSASGCAKTRVTNDPSGRRKVCEASVAIDATG